MFRSTRLQLIVGALAVSVVAGCDQRAAPAAHRASDAAAADWNGQGIDWVTPDQGLQRAREQNKPVCVVVSTTWCGHCRNYKRLFFDPRVVAESKKLVMIHVDSDKDPTVGRRYAPDGEYIPRTLFLGPDGALANIALARANYRHFYDESNPAELLAAMAEAQQHR